MQQLYINSKKLFGNHFETLDDMGCAEVKYPTAVCSSQFDGFMSARTMCIKCKLYQHNREYTQRSV